MSLNNEKILESLKNIDNNLEKINKNLLLLVLSSDSNIKLNLFALLDKENKKRAYKLTDGYNSARNIGKEIGLSISTINRWWKIWINSGIVTKNDSNYKYPIKIFSLDEIGLEIKSINNNDEYSDIYTRNQLKKILLEENVLDNDMILTFKNIFRKESLTYTNKNDLIEKMIDAFYNGSKRHQLMFIQYLRQKNMNINNELVNYFRLWENNIKSEVNW